jgi:hypothetical protein
VAGKESLGGIALFLRLLFSLMCNYLRGRKCVTTKVFGLVASLSVHFCKSASLINMSE